jgi:hypothetical protein
MAISGVNPKCYILALFVRDDGVRFLLGDDPFEFKDKQLHFQPNTVANDVVEVQGNDGYLLAGQVRRPGTQMFDGYVCNGTNSKEEVEAKRRAFLQFFRRSHFYKVIYVFPNGTAIQRKQGFLVDDPTVQELYQQYPEYHVALNFEDVNYYTYEEDDQGHEIYAKEAIIKLAGGGATGGLIWDNYGVVWENPWSDIVTVSGVDFQIDNLLRVRVPIEGTQLKGDTEQQTYSGKNKINGAYSEISQTVRCSAEASGNGFKITSTSSSGATYVTVPIPNITSLLGQTVALSYSASGSGIRIGFFYLNSSGSATSNISYTQTTTLPSSLGSNAGIGVVFYTSNNGSATYTDVQLEIGSTATSYEPYTNGPAPNPDYPQPIQVVAGEQMVSISDGNGNTQSYAISLGTIELCKLGDYQDYIYKSGNDWYVHKETGKIDLTNTSGWWASGTHTIKNSLANLGISNIHVVGVNQTTEALCNYFTARPSNSLYQGTNTVGFGISDGFYFSNNDWSLGEFNTFKSNNQILVYYALNTPTDTKITDATLVEQLEALDAMRLFIGENNILVSASSPNLPATFQFDYFTQYLEPHGAEWEEGGTKGATIVDVDAIDNTYPVWELIGPAINPTISVLTTNTTLTYNGTITASQKLVIDMFNKTVTLNGTSVIGNVTGDFVYMAPGTNRVAYTAGNADAPDSKISWQEVVG